MATIVLLLLISQFINYNLISCLVTDHQIVTWNSNGYKLPKVFAFLDKNPRIHSVFVQESGNVESNNAGTPIPEINLPKFVIADVEGDISCNNYADFIKVRTVTTFQNGPFYIYYSPSSPNVNPKISITIVSRHLARQIILFPSQHNRKSVCHDRAFTNRPIIGLVLQNNQNNNQNDIFLNIHAEPTGKRNEVITQLDIIRIYMNKFRKSSSWLLAGDFNRLPGDIIKNLKAQEQIVTPNGNTHVDRILDFLIYGSPDGQIFSKMKNAQYKGEIVQDANLVSDHTAVHFFK